MKLTLETIGHINLFERLTGAQIKHCWNEGEYIVFLVEPGNVQNGISSVSTAMETTRNASGGKRRRKRTFKKR